MTTFSDIPGSIIRVIPPDLQRLFANVYQDIQAVVDEKLQLLSPATAGNVPVILATGELEDSGKAAPTGDFVGTTDIQTLTNKTLTTPTIGRFVNATHNHQAAAGGGTLDHGAALTGLGDDDHTQYVLANGTRDIQFSSGTFEIGNVSGGNYVQFEADGTLEFLGDATVWDDMRIVPGSFDRPGISDPAITAYVPGGGVGITTYLYEFGLNDIVSFTVQMPHSYKVGSNIYVHVHWTPGARGWQKVVTRWAGKLIMPGPTLMGRLGIWGRLIYRMPATGQTTNTR